MKRNERFERTFFECNAFHLRRLKNANLRNLCVLWLKKNPQLQRAIEDSIFEV